MNISGIRPTAAIYEYKIAQAKSSPEVLKSQSGVHTEEQQPSEERTVQTGRNTQTETAFSYAQKYEPDKTYEMKGADSSLEDLDMEQAISDMKKDQLLQQYQFFVGSSRYGKIPVEDSIILPYENFEI